MMLQTPRLAAAAALLILATGVIARRAALPPVSRWLGLVAALMLAIAAGSPLWRHPRAGTATVLVDLSPSTRTADFRTRQYLELRLAELLGGTKFRLKFFADGPAAVDPAQSVFADVPCERTVCPPLVGDAVVLFSDCRFALPPSASPTYSVIDAALEHPPDAAVTNLTVANGNAVAAVANAGPARLLTVAGTNISAANGNYSVSRAIASDATSISARLSPGDAWPENDALSIIPPPPAQAQRWWVGGSDPGPKWKWMEPAALPVDPASYLAAGVIVLEDVSIAGLDAPRREALRQYAGELGGGIVIVRGDALPQLSPLSLHPPRPTTHWILLADGSGSMAELAAADQSRWSLAAAALVALLPELPPDDLVSVGSFAEKLDWWSQGKPAKQTAQMPLPPANAFPHGPTNLEPVLRHIAGAAGQLPSELFLVSDADVKIDDPAALTALLRRNNVHLHVLAIGDGGGLATLRAIAAATGGSVVQQLDPRRWTLSAQQLYRAAAQTPVEHEQLAVQFEDPLDWLGSRTVSTWKHAWMKEGAAELAFAQQDERHLPLAARWQVGEGSVAALVFDAEPEEITATANLIQRPPRDPHFRVRWETGPTLRLAVDANDGSDYLNDLHVTVQLAKELPVPQTGPGIYEIELTPPRSPVIAEVRVDGHVIDRTALAGRYAPEFDAIGNDRAAMEKLAALGGGKVIPPTDHSPIDFAWPIQQIALAGWLAGAAALLIAAALICWRLMPLREG
jgi:hypothetical protein